MTQTHQAYLINHNRWDASQLLRLQRPAATAEHEGGENDNTVDCTEPFSHLVQLCFCPLTSNLAEENVRTVFMSNKSSIF